MIADDAPFPQGLVYCGRNAEGRRVFWTEGAGKHKFKVYLEVSSESYTLIGGVGCAPALNRLLLAAGIVRPDVR